VFFDQYIYLAYLPYAWICAQIYILKRHCYLPLVGAYFISSYMYYQDATGFSALILAVCILVPLLLSAEILLKIYGTKWSAGYLKQHSVPRLITMSLLCPLFSKMIMLLIGHYRPDWVPGDIGLYFSTEKYDFNMTNMLFLPLSALVFFPVFYNANRFIFSHSARRQSLNWLRSGKWLSQSRALMWIGAIITVNVAYFLFSQSNAYQHYFTGAIYPLLFLLFVYAIHRHSLHTVMILWSLTVYILLLCIGDYVTPTNDVNLITSLMSVVTVFSLALQYLAITQYRYRTATYQLASHNENNPDTGLPNNRALTFYCQDKSHVTLCLVDMTNLYLLGKYYGPKMIIHVKQHIALALAQYKEWFKGVYDPLNNQLIVVISDDYPVVSAQKLKDTLRHMNLTWKDSALNLNYRLAWAVLHPGPGIHVDNFIHQLAFMARDTEKNIVNIDGSDASLTNNISHLQSTLSNINNALFNKHVLLYKQPIKGKDGDCYYEILARLEINGETIMPNVFLPIITEINCCAAFDLIVIEKSAQYIQANHQRNVDEKLSINLMPASLNASGLARKILAIFDRYGVGPENAIFEITEDQAVTDSENAVSNLDLLAKSGFKLAIDDFGVRHSNFERLSVLRADILKIDGLFIKNIITDPINHKIVASICDIARLKTMSVVAEFVETAEQYEHLCQMGVHYCQGYYIGKPELCFR
ncbi:EAL domain-containing protein, partial [Escherichia coli]